MKKHTLLSDIAVFLLIFFLFIVPPFFSAAVSPDRPLFGGWSFPWMQLLLALAVTVLLVFYYEKSDKRTLIIFPVLFTSGMLFSVALFCSFLSQAFFAGTGGVDGNSVVSPVGALQWFFCLIYFACAAYYEEVLYRFYFSDALFTLLEKKISRKGALRFTAILCEVLGLLAFAFAHLYLGWISVLNAALAHVFLRLCFKKSGKLWPCVVSHFIYNVISLILL